MAAGTPNGARALLPKYSSGYGLYAGLPTRNAVKPMVPAITLEPITVISWASSIEVTVPIL